MQKQKQYLFSDDCIWQHVIYATSFRSALQIAKDDLQIKGSVRCYDFDGNRKDYKLLGSNYVFSLREVTV